MPKLQVKMWKMGGAKFPSMWIIFGLHFLIFSSMGQNDPDPNVSIGIYHAVVFVLN